MLTLFVPVAFVCRQRALKFMLGSCRLLLPVPVLQREYLKLNSVLGWMGTNWVGWMDG